MELAFSILFVLCFIAIFYLAVQAGQLKEKLKSAKEDLQQVIDAKKINNTNDSVDTIIERMRKQKK